MPMKHVKIEYSNGRGKYGRMFAFIRPADKCSNRSRRVPLERLGQTISIHFPEINYYKIGGLIIGAKNETFALKEYWRICEKSKINQPCEVVFSHSAQNQD